VSSISSTQSANRFDAYNVCNSLMHANTHLHNLIKSTPKYVEQVMNYASSVVTPEYLSLFTHAHLIIPYVYLGDYQAFLSIDPQFVKLHPLIDEVDKELSSQLDPLGCSQLGIRHVISVTQFKPAASIPLSDWSRFKPNLGPALMTQVPIDDDELGLENLKPHLPILFKIIDKARLYKEPALVHCVKGASRSPSVIIAYLINRCRVSFEEAYNYVRSIRHQVEIKPSWEAGFKAFEKEPTL
jgi:hypothetical protein